MIKFEKETIEEGTFKGFTKLIIIDGKKFTFTLSPKERESLGNTLLTEESDDTFLLKELLKFSFDLNLFQFYYSFNDEKIKKRLWGLMSELKVPEWKFLNLKSNKKPLQTLGQYKELLKKDKNE